MRSRVPVAAATSSGERQRAGAVKRRREALYGSEWTITGPAVAVAGPTTIGREVLLDPGERAAIGFLRLLDMVEDADRRQRVVGE